MNLWSSLKRDQSFLAGNSWPTQGWCHAKIAKFIGDQRDLYTYIYDQTVRLMNHGMTGIEIAELVPSTLVREVVAYTGVLWIDQPRLERPLFINGMWACLTSTRLISRSIHRSRVLSDMSSAFSSEPT